MAPRVVGGPAGGHQGPHTDRCFGTHDVRRGLMGGAARRIVYGRGGSGVQGWWGPLWPPVGPPHTTTPKKPIRVSHQGRPAPTCHVPNPCLVGAALVAARPFPPPDGSQKPPRVRTARGARTLLVRCVHAVQSRLALSRCLFGVAFCLLFLLISLGCALGPSPFLLVAMLIALGMCLWALYQPQIAVLLVFAGAGLPSFLLPLPGHTMRPVEPALLLCLLVVIAWRTSLRLRLPHLLTLLFLAIAVVSFIHVPQIATSLNAYGADKRLYGLVLLFLALYCGTWLARHIKDASRFLVNVLLINMPLYLIMLAQSLGLALPSLLENSNAQDPKQTLGRLWGPFDGAVTLGLYLTNLFAVALSCWMLGTRRRERWVGAIMTIVTALGIFGSGTRSAALAAGLILIIALVMTRRFAWLFIIILLIALLVGLFPTSLLGPFAHDASSTDNRLWLWQEAIFLIKTHPWIGIGLQQFPVYYAHLIVSQATLLNPQGISVHNQYLELAMESGILWLVVGVLLLLSMLYLCWQAYQQAQQQQRVVFLAALLVCAATLLAGFFDVPLDKTEEAVFLFLLVGLALGYAEYLLLDSHQHRSRSHLTAGNVCWDHTPPPSIRWRASHWWHAPRPLKGTISVFQAHTQHLYENSDENKAKRPQSRKSVDPQGVIDGRKTGRSILVQLLSWGIAVPIVFPTTALLAHYLGPVQYGEYSATLPFLAVFALLTGTGMDPLLVRRLSRQARSAWSETLSYAAGTRLLSTSFSVFCAMTVTLLLPVGAEQRLLFLLGSLSLFFSYSFNGLRIIYEHGFRAEERVEPMSLLDMLNRILTAALIAFTVLLRLPFILIYILLLSSDLPFCLVLMLIARRRFGVRLRFSLKRSRELLHESLPLNGYNVMTLISGQVDMLLLAILSNAQDVGIYALASRITDPLIALVLAYAGGLYPLFCKAFAEGRGLFAQMFTEATRVLALFIIPLSIFISFEASTIVALLGGPQFAAATPVVQCLMWAMAVTFFNQLAVRACTSVNEERRIPLVTFVSASVNLLLNLLLIPSWHSVGASIAALLSECVGLNLFLLLLRPRIHLLKIASNTLLVLVSNIPALVFLLWQQHTSLLLVTPFDLLITLLGYLITGSLSMRDLAMIGRILKQQRSALQQVEARVASPSLPVLQVTDRPTIVLPRAQI
jgi:O-antigen/teichoic acid export membrane protein